MCSLVVDNPTENGEKYSSEELESVKGANIPRHVAIMMDGNRRWAKLRGLPNIVGHWQGADSLTKIVKAASELGIEVLTVWALSTENWSRPADEIDGLMHLFKVYLQKQKHKMVEEGVKFDTIGDLSRLPQSVREELEETKKATRGGKKIDLVLAINYGGRDDIRRATQAIVTDCLEGKLLKENLSEAVISGYLDTAKWRDPDLIIRTSGELRLSNFLLWQLSYAEIYITDVLWPDFNEKELLKAVLTYQQRERRLGGR